tara:strand:+ start:628 stop:825 length:198 start_codon:yes stop_codon:yes gene_type:complete
MKITDQQIIETMRKYGSGFASALAVTASLATDYNLERIKRAFPKYWRVYEAYARRNVSKLERDDA